MVRGVDDRERRIQALDDAVTDAAGFFSEIDESLCGGYQTAREVLSHLVFWHREYVAIVRALLEGRELPLRSGTFAQLNAGATEEFAGRSFPELVEHLIQLQHILQADLRRLPDWEMRFPVKHGSRLKCTADRVERIESHIRNHVKQLRRAERLGQAWVKAYYPESG